MKRAMALIFWALVASSPANAGEDVQWVSGEGYADVKGNMTFEQARRSALEAAREQALQRAVGLKLTDRFSEIVSQRGEKSAEFVEHAVVAESEGLVLDSNVKWQKPELISTGRDEPAFTRLRVKAEFKIARLPASDPSFQVRLKLNRARFIAGDMLRLEVSATENCHLYVFNIAADDMVYPIYPNPQRPKVWLQRGGTLILPEPKDGQVIRLFPLDGHDGDVEGVRVIAARSPLALPSERSFDLIQFNRWLYSLPRTQWVDATAAYSVFKE